MDIFMKPKSKQKKSGHIIQGYSLNIELYDLFGIKIYTGSFKDGKFYSGKGIYKNKEKYKEIKNITNLMIHIKKKYMGIYLLMVYLKKENLKKVRKLENIVWIFFVNLKVYIKMGSIMKEKNYYI